MSRLRNLAAEHMEKIISAAVSQNDRDLKGLDDIQKLIEEVAWLPRGFKSSLNVEISFARANIKKIWPVVCNDFE